MAIAKLNEAMLFNMGFDRVAIDALRHLLKQVGNETDATTLPAIVEQVSEVRNQVDGIDQAPVIQPSSATASSDENVRPPVQPFIQAEQLDQRPPTEMAQQVEFLETQVRSLAEQVVALSRRLRDIEQGASL